MATTPLMRKPNRDINTSTCYKHHVDVPQNMEIKHGSYAYPQIVSGSVNHTAVSISAIRYTVPHAVVEILREKGEYSDLVKWAQVAAVEARTYGYDLKQTFNAAQRYAYRAMRNAGFSRQRGQKHWLYFDTVKLCSTDQHATLVVDDNDDEEIEILENVLFHIFKDSKSPARDVLIITLTLRGWTDESIAKELGIAPSTVQKRRRLLRKKINSYMES